MYAVYYAEGNDEDRLSNLGYFNSFDDAVIFALSDYISNTYKNKFDVEHFLTYSKKNKIKFFKDAAFIYIVKIKDNSSYLKFDFNLINKITNYKIINNLIITNLGIFKASKKEIEKFEKLIIFK